MQRTLIMAVLLGAASLPQRARAEVVKLETLEQLALENRPALLRDGARARAAEADVRKAASAYYPQFALKADSSVGPGRQLLRVGGDVNENGTPPEKGGYLVQGAAPLTSGSRKSALLGYPRSGVELAASANLYDFGRTQAATSAGREGHAAALATRALTEAELRGVVRESYLAWLLSSELLQLATDAQAQSTARRERVAALISEGARPKGELSPARADELLAQLELERAQRDFASARLALEHAVGAPLEASAEPDAQLLQAQATLPDRSERDDRSRRMLLQRFKAAQAAAHAQATLNRPQLGVGLSAGVRVATQKIIDVGSQDGMGAMAAPHSEGNQTKVFPLYTAGLTLNVPLWDGGYTRASADAARARADEARADLTEFEQERDFTQSQAQLDARSALTRLETAQELVEVCAARLKDAEAGYDLGASSIELIGQARGLLRRARTEELMARADHAAARLHMVKRDGSRAPP